MTDPKKTHEVPTPPARPYDERDTAGAPGPVDVEAPRSTDEDGKEVSLPDLGGEID